MKKLLQGFLVLLTIVYSGAAFSQSVRVSGTITDESEQPLPGASILLKGTSIGTVTDIDGKFTINISGENPVLVVSFLGYITQ